MITADDILRIEKVFISLAKIDCVPFNQKSISKIYSEANIRSISLEEVFGYSEELKSRAALFISEALDYFNLANPEERIKFLQIIGEIDFSKFEILYKHSPDNAIGRINKVMQERLITYQIITENDITKKNRVFVNLKKIILSKNALLNVYLLLNYQYSADVLPYTNNYLATGINFLEPALTELSKVRAESVCPIHNIPVDEMIKATLKKLGFNNLIYENKDSTALIKILSYNFFAVRAVLKAKLNKIEAPNKNTLIDYIARDITREELELI